MIEAPTCCFMLHSSPGRGISSFTLGWGRRQPTGEGSDASEESAATTPVPGNLRTELHHPRNAATQGHNALESPGARRLALPECQPTTAASLAREIARVTEHDRSRDRAWTVEDTASRLSPCTSSIQPRRRKSRTLMSEVAW